MEKEQNKSASFSLLEIIVSVAVFSIFSASMITAIVGVRSDYDKGSDRLIANFLLNEGLEAVRSIRDQAWSNLSAGSYGVQSSSGSWAFSGTGTTIGSHTRSVTLTSVSSTRFDVTVTVFWYTQEGLYLERTLTSRLTNWILPPPEDLAMMVYDANEISAVPKYRVWDGSGWSAEASLNSIGGDIRHTVLRYAPTRDEAVAVMMGSTGAIWAQVYDGTGNTWGATVFIGEHLDSEGNGTVQALYRGFDVEYEQSSGDLILVYGDGTADPNYRTWNGSAWSDATDIDVPNADFPNWIEMAALPGSDELAFITVNGSGTVHGMHWDGGSWSGMGNSTGWGASDGQETEKSIDVAFEKTSGDVMFTWVGSASTQLYYRTWNGSTLSDMILLSNTQAGDLSQWLRLASNPASGSDEIMFGIQDSGLDLNTFLWSGSAWSSIHSEHTATSENALDMNFDIVWETHTDNPNDAWLIYGNGSTVSRKLWSSGAWGAATTSGDDTANIQLVAQPNSGAVLAGIYEDGSSATDDLNEMNLTGGSQTWSSPGAIWSGPVTRNLGSTKLALAAQAYNTSTEAMMVYDVQSVTTVPKYRIWDGSVWSDVADATTVGGEIRHIELRYAPTRDEAVMVVLGSTGAVQAQVWNGSSWGSVSIVGEQVNSQGSGDEQSFFHAFAVEYEKSSGDAVVVYADGSADPDYRVWDGTGWSAASDINVPTTGSPHWIEMASRKTTDQLALILHDFNNDIYGLRWDGSAWDNMGSGTTWDGSGANENKKTVSVAYENNSGEIMYLWGDSVTTDQYYRTYEAGALTNITLLDNPNAGGLNQWMELAANPTSGSDELMYGVLDNGADLNTFLWSGTGWSAVHTEHDASTEDVTDMNFDLIYETHSANPNDAWLVWGDDATISRSLWSDGAWNAPTSAGDDTAVIVLNANPDNGDVLAGIYSQQASENDDLWEMHLTAGSQTWTSPASLWGGPIARAMRLMRMSIDSSTFNTD